MKRLLLIPILTLYILSNAQTTIPNADFENWQNVGSNTEEPTNWNGNETGGGFANLGPQTIFQETNNPHGGSYCVRMTNGSYFGTPINATVTTGRVEAPSTNPNDGYVQTVTGDANFNTPFTGRPDSLVGWYRLTAAGGDQPKVSIFLHENYDYEEPDQGSSAAYLVGSGSMTFSSVTVGNWTRFSIPITYSNANTPTHALIIMTASDTPGTADTGTSFWVDDLEAIYCTPSTGTDVQVACDTYDWIDGNTYTTSNNTATHILSNATGCDSIVTLDLTVNNSNTGTDTQTACVSYTWIDGNTYTNSNTTATYILTNQAGCDSTVTLDLTINPLPNTNVLQSGATLTADLFGADYQWLDCDDNYAVIGGETSQSFTPTVTGNYAVELILAGCSDTSDCYLIDFTGLSDLDAEHLEIYPNPTNNGIVFINYDGQIDAIEVLDMAGREVLTSVSIENNQIDISKLEMGNYLIRITTNQGVVMKEVTVVR